MNPIFKETFTFEKLRQDNFLHIEVYDYDAYKSDDKIGGKSIDLTRLNPNEVVDKWYDLEDKNGKIGNCGKIRIILQLLEHSPPQYGEEIK